MNDPRTPRQIVLLAASLARGRYTRDWFRADERGTWEKEAASMLWREPKAYVFSPEYVAKAIALELNLMSATAQLNRAIAKKGNR